MKTDIIKKRLEELGKTRFSLAKKLNIDPSAMSRAMAGQRQFKSHEIPIIADFLGMDVSSLFEDKAHVRGDVSTFETLPLKYHRKNALSSSAKSDLMHTEAVLIALDTLKKEEKPSSPEDINNLARAMCEIANQRNTSYLSADLARWLINSSPK